ncbi:MAG: carbon storage regulator CsrA [Pyrinomonadaceae bacterium]
MLVLSRRSGQKIVIGNEVVVDVLGISGDGVKLGISAPGETSVHRYEVFVEIQEANRAAEVAADDLENLALGNLSEMVRKNKDHEAI